MTEIRLARYKDLFAIDALIQQAWSEHSSLFPEPEYPAAYHWALDLIANGFVSVAVEPDASGRQKIVGVTMMELKCLPQTPSSKFLGLEYFYVLPDYRASATEDGKSIAAALLDNGRRKAHAASMGVGRVIPLVWGFNSGDERSEAKERQLEMAGFDRVGANFVYTPQPDDFEPVQEAA